MSVHYKFKSNVDYDTVTFDGVHISVSDLKKAIMQQKKIGKSSDFDLQITNAQTEEVYKKDEDLVLKNTSVIVARVPVVSTGKKSWDKPELPLPLDDGDKGHIRFDRLVKSADIANTNATEDDKVKAMISQSSQEYDPSKYVKSRSMTGPLPPTYTCFRCGKQGHWIKNCPTNNLDIKRSTGIPRSFMVPVDGPEHKGALLTSSGDYAVPIIDHHAYKEVKKEKPPFIFEPEAPPEPEAEIPEELLCMFCKSLLQEAVLIPCCGNSFCDECVRQALLDSDNHECPVCHEIDISPDTVIPNRFLRTAVLNFKNETGYTRVKKLFQPVAAPAAHIESPQPSPDSTVENQPVENQPVPGEQDSVDIKDEFPEPVKDEPILIIKPEKEEIDEVEEGEMENEEEKLPEEPEEPMEEEEDGGEEEDASPPGTPLADEPADDSSETLPIQQGGQEEDYDDYRPSSFRSNRFRDDYDNDTPDEDSEPRQISTIETVRRNFGGRPLPNMQSNMHHHRQQQHYSTGMLHRDNRQHDYEQRGREFHGRYDRRNQNERRPPLLRGPRMNRYDMTQNDRYHHQDNRRDYTDYTGEPRHIREPRYDTHLPSMESRRPVRYGTPPLPTVIPPAAVPPPVPVAVPAQIDIASQYGVQPTAVSASQPLPTLLPPTQAPSFPPQPPPPGASPIDHSSHIPPQPPPPGVGPLLSSSVLPEPPQPSSFPGPPFKSEEVKPKQEERSIDDRMEAFQRELDKRASERVRERASRSSSRSRKRSRSTSRSSHSRSYSSSKSWSRTSSRSLSRSSRSRSRASYSSRSRSRSYSRSRSRSKSRSYSRSRSRSADVRQRSKSRSRSREREKRRGNSRDRQHPSYSKNHSPSHSPPLRNFIPRNRQSPYPVRRPYNPPVQYGASSYTAPYNAPTALLPVPVLRTASYAPTHLHSSHPIQTQPVPHTHPIEHYPLERTRYAAYNDPYPAYDMYQHAPKTYGHQRYERDPRTQRYETSEYQKEYPRREDDIQQRIPGWVGDRNRDYRPRFRQVRDQQRKEIKELPKLCEPEVKSEIRVREPKEKQEYFPKRREDMNSRRREEVNEKKKEEINAKKKEERVSTKHKKHRHRSKENKKVEKQESKIPVVVSTVSTQDLITVQVQPDSGKAVKLKDEEIPAKVPEKVKEKKHKHKKHKMEEQVAKKRKVAKKEKVVDINENSETNVKVKTKKRRNKVKALIKALEETKKREKSGSKHSKKIKLETSTEKPEAEVAKVEDPDVLTVTADDLNLETENHDDYTDDVIKLHTSTEDFELDLEATEEKSEINHEKEATAPEEAEVPTLESQENPKPAEPTDKDTSINASLIEEEEEEEAVDDTSAYEQDALPEEDNELHVEVPELSKWEREELEDEDISKPQRKSTVVIPKSTKGIATLSSDIIQRAEKVIMQKPLKTAILQGSTSNGKEKIKSEKKLMSKVDSPIDSTSSKHSEVKSTSDRSRSPSLQVTISTEKEKRSVQAKDEAQQQQPRRIKLDRSSFKSIEPPKPPSTSHRTVVVEEPLIILKKSDEKPQRKVENRTVIAKREHTKIHGPDYKPENESKSLTSRNAKEIVKTGGDRKRDYDRNNQRSNSQESSRRKDGVTSDRNLTREESDFYRTQKDIRTVITDYDRSGRRYANTQSSRAGAPQKESYKRSHSQSSNSNDNPHYLSKRQNISSDSRRHEYRSDHHSHHDRSERHKKTRSPSSSHSPKKSQNKKQSAVRMVSVTAHKGGEKYSSTYDESKFEPDYDEFSDTNPREAGKEKSRLNLGSEIQGQGSVSHKRLKVTEKEQRKLEKRKTASSSSGASSSSSDSESEESTDEKTVKHKSSDIEHKRHKKSKHKKHKKHKHKKKRSHRSKVKT